MRESVCGEFCSATYCSVPNNYRYFTSVDDSTVLCIDTLTPAIFHESFLICKLDMPTLEITNLATFKTSYRTPISAICVEIYMSFGEIAL